MTPKHQLVIDYHRRRPVIVTINSYLDYKVGLRDTLEHIVKYQFQDYKIILKPPYKDYKRYIFYYEHPTPPKENFLPPY